MIGKKDVSQALDIGVDQIMHMTYECAEFERIIRLQDMKAYEKALRSNQTCGIYT